MKVWILTDVFNDYDQHGEYFVAVFAQKPTHPKLVKREVPSESVEHVLNGGGRIKDEYHWFYLREYELK